MTDLGAIVAKLQKDVAALQRESRLSSASLDNAALQVRDDSGSLRALVGQQGDGTTAVNIVNGPPPPTPSVPTVAPALAGLAVTWDGTFANTVAAPLDWMRCEVHVGATAGFTPSQGTLRDTIESPQGGMVTIPLPYTEWFVKLRSRTSSGAASAATTGVSGTPRKAATTDLTAGIVTADLIAVDALTGKTITGGTINGTTITGGTVTGSTVQTATTGKRIALLPDGTMALYSGRTGGETPGSLESGINSDGEMQLGYLVLKPPTHGPTPPEITLAVGPSGEQQWYAGPLTLLAEGGNGYTYIAGDVSVTGRLAVTNTAYETYTPTVGNAGTATWSTRDGWYYKLGTMVFFQAYLVASAAGSGTTGITISLPSTPWRGSANRRQYFGIYAGGIAAGTNSAVGGHAVGLIQPDGSGAQLDQVRGATDIQLRGNNIGATSTFTINGWYREA
ncbi:hypothetical protein AB0L71_28615 [Streptomyces sp. NPDC052052]|uniref:hypothetical protein n=1 Tax=Streptomyces sp. NPDC052052 TaxID=3154756 RepID=UPI00344A7B2B